MELSVVWIMVLGIISASLHNVSYIICEGVRYDKTPDDNLDCSWALGLGIFTAVVGAIVAAVISCGC